MILESKFQSSLERIGDMEKHPQDKKLDLKENCCLTFRAITAISISGP